MLRLAILGPGWAGTRHVEAIRELGRRVIVDCVILTYECTGRCAHSCYRTGPGQGSTMTVAGLCDLDGVCVSRGPARMVGRAADGLSPFLGRGPSPQPSSWEGEGEGGWPRRADHDAGRGGPADAGPHQPP